MKAKGVKDPTSKASKRLELKRTKTKTRPWIWPLCDEFKTVLSAEQRE